MEITIRLRDLDMTEVRVVNTKTVEVHLCDTQRDCDINLIIPVNTLENLRNTLDKALFKHKVEEEIESRGLIALKSTAIPVSDIAADELTQGFNRKGFKV